MRNCAEELPKEALEGGGAPSGILPLHGREMSCEVKVEMWRPLCESNGSYFETGGEMET